MFGRGVKSKTAVVEGPLRAELLSVEQLKQVARKHAHEHKIVSGSGYNRLLPRLDDNARALHEAHKVLLAADAAGRRMSPPDEWLLDNFYLIEQQIELARIHLPRRYSHRLPRLTAGPYAGLPRVYGMAAALIAHLDGALDTEAINAYVSAYQTAETLKLSELWAIPISLRLGIIENLRRVAVRIANRRRELENGIVWAERVLTAADTEPARLINLLARFADTQPKLSAPFLSEFVSRLQGRGPAVGIILNWIDQALSEEATTVTQRLQRDSHEQAAEHLSVTNSIGSLRFLDSVDWKTFVEEQSRVEQILRRDPVDAYAAQDFATRDHYRHVVERLASRSGRSETDVAQMALEQASGASPKPDCTRARHVGSYLIGGDRFAFRRLVGCPLSLRYLLGLLLRGYRLFFYLGGVLFITALVAAFPAWSCGLSPFGWRFWLLAVAAFIPASTLALSLVNFMVTARVAPHPLPRLDFSKGIPDEHRTLVAVPTLLSGQRTLNALLETLEIRYLGNRDPNLRFALLTDFPDADAETLPTDGDLLQRALQGIALLNERYPRADGSTAFYLFHRPRVWNPHERCWMGYERKRGKLGQFNARLRGECREAFTLQVGDLTVLPSIRYVITLDSDTDLPRGAAQAMAGAMAHPLNRPRFDPDCGRVVEGYAILQPRVSIRLAAANRSLFAHVSCGETGLDPYSREVSDVYQDLFSEGSFVGKGIYDVDAFRKALDGRFPDNLILSHDLIESAYARSGLLGCVEVYEDAPSSYLGEVCRQHRWMRGDWQIAPWLRRRPPSHGNHPARRQPVSNLLQWKVVDNLRRCLAAPSMLLLLLVGWNAGPVAPWCWTLFILAVLGLADVVRSITLLLRKPHERGMRLHLRTWGSALLRHCAQPLFAVSVLPYEAWVALGAFARSALRAPFTRRGLLIWHLPHYRRLATRTKAIGFYSAMWPAPALAFGAAALMVARRPEAWPAVLPVAVLWLAAPLTAWAVSRPLRQRAPKLTPAQWRLLHQLACRTWRYFDTFATERENGLPPDNFQETPEPMIASRTSPTNIGFGLAACLTAWDFGYISTTRLIERLTRTFDTLEKLERYRGHFFNWYDTRSLKPLPPRYVSSVDSGNLAAALVALRSGLQGLDAQPALPAQIWRGLRDALEALGAAARREGSADFMALLNEAGLMLVAPPEDGQGRLERLQSLLAVAERMTGAAATERFADAEGGCAFFERLCRDHADSTALLLSDAPPGTALRQLARGAADETAHGEAHANAARLVKAFGQLAERCRQLQMVMDFRFLYNRERELLSVGFNVDMRRLDPSCYDLLASEARVASLLMIADEQAPTDHWFALGRLLAGHGGATALVSWSGSMFEYLMPALLLASYPDTLLDRTCRSVIQRQIRYGRQRNVPWGVSESCYHATDAQHVYQYRAFGVPGLGLKRGLADDLVIAPYATLLALPFAPTAACANIERLLAIEGVLGPYGLIEAIDYTPSRTPRGKPHALVRCYMSHHQGMGLLALSHLLLDAPMVRRFMSEPAVRATEVLLQERIPEVSPKIHPHRFEAASAGVPESADAGDAVRRFNNPAIPVPEVHLLSNGRYHVMVNQAGGGSSRWHGLSLTRWREDITCDNWGIILYLRDVETNAVWANTSFPFHKAGRQYEALFTQGRAEYRRLDFDIETRTEICVSPEDDVEVRRVTLTNRGARGRRLELTSFAEIVLAAPEGDLAHRAFSNLFVQTEILPCGETILCTRLKREEHEQEVWYFQKLCVMTPSGTASCETNRETFIGRGRTPANAIALEAPAGSLAPLANTAGAVLDPIAAVRQPVELADEPLHAHLICGVAATREAALALAEKYRDRHFVERAFDMAWSHSQIILRLLNVSEAEAQVFGRLASSMLYANPRNRAPWTVVARNRTGQQALWRFGISGDRPVMLLRIADLRSMDLVTDALRAHAYWRLKGFESDLVILNEDFSGYRATLNDRIVAAINTGPRPDLIDQPGGIFLRRIENLSEEDQILFQSVARVVLTDGAETLREQAERRYVPHRPPAPLKPESDAVDQAPEPLAARERILISGPGGFTPDGREYIIMLEPGTVTPAPWVNVIAGRRIGMVVSESGGGYTWIDNAHEYRLTTWHNDPVSDPNSEAFYLRDEETGQFWSLTPRPAPGRNGYVCRHGFGYTVFEHAEAGLASELWLYAAPDAPLRCATVKITNTADVPRRISLTAFHELVLGEWRHDNVMHIHTEADSQNGLLLARNPYSRIFPQRVAFASCSEPEVVMSGDRTEFIGRNGTLARPAALFRQSLSGRTGARYDPAAVLQTFCDLAPGETREVIFTLGAAETVQEARQLQRQFGGSAGAHAALDAVWEYWNRVLGAVRVEIPGVPAVNALVNGWLLYQTLSCRIRGRSGFYQSGGAYGFRDQLQDAMALLHAAPDVLRQQILMGASRQFREGDVQHWWHPPVGAGVRTRITDDRLWLPQAVARYVLATGDTGILDEEVPFLDGRSLAEGEESRYDQHNHASETASLYEHCVRAIRISLRYGAHGLPLIGGGDWNDGLNRVGLGGRGESVWMAWFLGDTLRRFGAVARLRGDQAFDEFCQEERKTLGVRVEESAWDGEWYRRAYFDDGTPLGSKSNSECRIDAISQSWAVLSGMGRASRACRAMQAVREHLVRSDDGLILLLTPPFAQTPQDPGYIKCYPPGVRENGGQYTHAAVWTVMAFAEIGDLDTAWALFNRLNPVNHCLSPEALKRYRVEPYVMAADIYGAPPFIGRGGWSWYTGAAGWMYRLAVETLLGLERYPDYLLLKPRLPQDGPPKFRILYRHQEQTYTIEAIRVPAEETPQVTVDGAVQPDGRIPLQSDRRDHCVTVTYCPTLNPTRAEPATQQDHEKIS
ncbi:MAG: glucoamylase family protein [Kiritimatiellae bacterium]|nr:glucoamylase family protein [Kiritimatiellia bacterium]